MPWARDESKRAGHFSAATNQDQTFKIFRVTTKRPDYLFFCFLFFFCCFFLGMPEQFKRRFWPLTSMELIIPESTGRALDCLLHTSWDQALFLPFVVVDVLSQSWYHVKIRTCRLIFWGFLSCWIFTWDWRNGTVLNWKVLIHWLDGFLCIKKCKC